MVENTQDTAIIIMYVTAPLICLVVNAGIQILSFRVCPKIGLLKSVYVGFLAGFGGIIILDVILFKFFPYLFRDTVSGHIVNIIIYAALGYCYFHFVGLSETARRIRLIIEIYKSKDGLSLEEMLKKYNAAEILENRIARLLNNGQLRYSEGRYFIGKPLVLLIWICVNRLKLLLLGREREIINK